VDRSQALEAHGLRIGRELRGIDVVCGRRAVLVEDRRVD